jgi:hypothetical protein
MCCFSSRCSHSDDCVVRNYLTPQISFLIAWCSGSVPLSVSISWRWSPIPLRVSQFPACMIPVVPWAERRVREAERAGASSIPEMQRRLIIYVIVDRESLSAFKEIAFHCRGWTPLLYHAVPIPHHAKYMFLCAYLYIP